MQWSSAVFAYLGLGRAPDMIALLMVSSDRPRILYALYFGQLPRYCQNARARTQGCKFICEELRETYTCTCGLGRLPCRSHTNPS